MRICLVGDFRGNPDEGMKNVSKNILKGLLLNNDVLAINSRDVYRKAFLAKIRSFKPEIIHYLHGPTIRSLIFLKVAKCFSGSRPKAIISATRPYFSKFSRWAIPLFKPDLVLTQSIRFEAFFEEKGFRVKFFPNGVDCQKFIPVTETDKLYRRKKFDLPENKKIILHVGHIKTNRNLEVFKEIQQIENVQVVIVGSITGRADERLKEDLQKAGIKVFNKLYNDISQCYKMSDLYVFPVKAAGNKLPDSYNQVGAIDLPLSVLEAMACNLPVITTRFGALQRLFQPGDGFHYAEDEADIIAKVKNFFFKNVCETRQKVLPYDWGRIVARIEMEYRHILQ